MKILLGSFMLLGMVSCAMQPTLKPYGKGHELNIKNAMKNQNFNDDKFNKHAFVSPLERIGAWDEKVPASNNWMKLNPYVAIDKSKKKEKTVKRLAFSLNKDHWLFMSHAHFMCGDKELEVTMPSRQIQRDVIYGSAIREYYDHKLSEKEFNFLAKCKKGEKYRIYGEKGYLEFSWKPEEITYFKEVKLISNYAKKKGSRGIANIVEEIKKEEAEAKKK